MASGGRQGWGDEDDEEQDFLQVGALPEPTETVDDKGIKTITSYRIHDGERQRVVRRVKTVTRKKKVPKCIKERKEWKKFGLCKNAPPGPEEETTIESRDEIFVENPGDEAKAAKREEEEVLKRLRAGALRRKFNQQMDEKKAGIAASLGLPSDAPKTGGLRTGTALSQMAAENNLSGLAAAGSASGKYVPAHLRAGAAAASMSSRFGDDSDQCTLRVSNISEDTTEDDLRSLFSAIGRVQRVYLAKDRETQQSRGFAYVSYYDRRSAEKALEKLNGYGYDYLILKVEWAKPSSKEDVGSQNLMAKGIVSGYGGALPQGFGK